MEVKIKKSPKQPIKTVVKVDNTRQPSKIIPFAAPIGKKLVQLNNKTWVYR